ncbi:MAG TPA: matrixin family metalloprotease, partial [Patescibacteria group bacterium]|nr:matrixin family metalloprotease [Patescibacteria group bacterium]
EAEFLAVLEPYNKKVEEFNRKVAAYNAGKPSPDRRRELEEESERLSRAQSEVIEKKAAYDKAVKSQSTNVYSSVNARINEYNSLLSEINGETGRFNYSYQTNILNFKLNEHREIEIYAFPDLKGLVAVLEHELGHSIGLDHTPVSGNIMSAVSKEELTHKNTILTPTDIRLMLDYCLAQSK